MCVCISYMHILMRWQGVDFFLVCLWALLPFISFLSLRWLMVIIYIPKAKSFTNIFSETCNWSQHSSAVSEMGNRHGAKWWGIPTSVGENKSFFIHDWCHSADWLSPLQLCNFSSGSFLVNIFFFVIPNSGMSCALRNDSFLVLKNMKCLDSEGKMK